MFREKSVDKTKENNRGKVEEDAFDGISHYYKLRKNLNLLCYFT
jgi:hypothetical protein